MVTDDRLAKSTRRDEVQSGKAWREIRDAVAAPSRLPKSFQSHFCHVTTEVWMKQMRGFVVERVRMKTPIYSPDRRGAPLRA